jgi:hypothetical protein
MVRRVQRHTDLEEKTHRETLGDKAIILSQDFWEELNCRVVLVNADELSDVAPMCAEDHLSRMLDAPEPTIPTLVLEAIRDVVGPKGWIKHADKLQPYLREERGLFVGHCAAVVLPKSTDELARVVQLCADAGIPVVPHGGNTGLVGGGVPRGGIVLSTVRLDRIRCLDLVNRSVTVEAGVILADVQAAADEAGRYSLSAWPPKEAAE